MRQHFEIDQRDAVDIAGRRIDVTREGKVDQGHLASTAGGFDSFFRKDDAAGPGAGNENVRGTQLDVHGLPTDRADTERRDERIGPLEGAVGHHNAARRNATFDERFDRKGRHCAGAGDEKTRAVIRDQFARGVEACRDDRGAEAIDAGFGMTAFADAQCLLEQQVERRTDGRLCLCYLKRIADLTEDLAFTGNHRVEARSHGKEMRDNGLVIVHIDVANKLFQVEAGMVGEQPGDLFDAAVKTVGLDVDLDAVAGRDDHGFADERDIEDKLRQLDRRIGIE